MSWNDKAFMSMGHHVRHKYERGLKRCVRCGTRRRMTSSGWEWWNPMGGQWSTNNPPCARKITEESHG